MFRVSSFAFRVPPARGFALLDLMISVLILGLFLVPLAISRNNVIVMAGQTVSLRKARLLAAQKIGELELLKLEDLSDSGGDFGEDHPGFLWETRVEILPLEEVVDLEEEQETEEGAYESSFEDEDEEELLYEIVRLTLVVRFMALEETMDLEEETLEEEARKRPGDRIVIVRYYLKEPEEEEEGEGW